jgi:hypothetical protein
VSGLPCIWLQDAGGRSTYTLLPDTRTVSYMITDIRDKRYSIVRASYVHFLYYVILYITR